jgi:hypothetical protein
MSAFIVGAKHIDALLTFANAHDAWLYPYGRASDTEKLSIVGNVLLAENYRSVNHRYPGDAQPYDNSYVFRFYQHPITPIEALKACACYDYQACETDNYESTDAAKLIRAIRDTAIRELPGWDQARGWEFR